MNELLELAVEAHGGLERWNQFEKVAVDMTLEGVLWGFFGYENNPIARTTFESRLRQQHIEYLLFREEGQFAVMDPVPQLLYFISYGMRQKRSTPGRKPVRPGAGCR